MKPILIWVFKGLLLLTLLALLVLLIFGLVLWIGWSWWVGFFLLIGLIGLTLGALVVRKILLRRREQMFVHEVIAQDESIQRGLAPAEQDTAKELQARWKEAIEALRKSHLRKYGNPLYVLPWYMVIGESGSGKTTAIKSARLSSPFAEVSHTSGISGTRNCDWWFFEQAIILDTAGRYALPVDEGRDKDEWQKFLTLLARFRKREPLNGLVVTVAADRLAQATVEALQEDGRNIRRRIEELTRVLGARSPVYVMVTKCDLIQGASQFCSQLPEEALNQAMGYLNQEMSSNVGAVIDKCMRTVGDRLRDLRLLLLQRIKTPGSAADLLLFPEELENLKEKIAAFVGSAFQENPYQETPLLRAIFFSSGHQEGTPFSHFLNTLGLIQAPEVLKGTDIGLFLHDVFAKILPADRHLFRPTQHMQEWRKLTRNMGLTAWIAFMVALCGLLSYSFVKNLAALSDVRKEFGKPAVLQGELLADVITMDRFRNAVIQVEEQNRRWWIPRLGLDESLELEAQLKQKYVDLFQKGFLQRFDQHMNDRLTGFGPSTPPHIFGAHVTHLVRRINLLKGRLAQDDLSRLSALAQADYSPEVLGRTELIPEIQKKVAADYLYAVAWDQDASRLNTELTALQTWLKHLMTMPGANLNWLAEWVNADPSAKPVALHDFWGGASGQTQAKVPGAFTHDGKKIIDQTIAEIESALFDPLIIAAHKVTFADWYRSQFFKSWEAFAASFGEGTNLLQERDNWQVVAKRVPTESGPYFSLIDRVVTEFDAFDPEMEMPAWVGMAYAWQDVLAEAQTTHAVDLQKAGIIRKATQKVTSKIRTAERALGVKVRKPMDAKAQLDAAKAMTAYLNGLDEAAKATQSRLVAFEMASALYQQEAATGDSPFLTATRAVDDMKALMSDAKDEQERLFWDLIQGNVEFLHAYTNRETACHLQALWEREVLLELQDVSRDTDVAQMLMGSSGYATQFIKGSAAPFIGRSLSKGYYARKILGQEVPLESDFLPYLSKGARAARPTQSSYRVKVRAYPTDTNTEATVRPHATVLELQCADSSERLENLNYPVAKTFTWSPGNCGDVLFRISVGNLSLTKTYGGHHAFAKFLNDFKTGQRTFMRDEFPSEEAALRRMGIRFIKAKYQFQGHSAVLELLYSAPGAPPRKIAPCWD
ncbi:type VI secretion protein IcmF/TssM N-terminal domain-containing protein [Desulfatitalea tepidiphila]|uniref:type VI secretion protein IcmF/TssM N-terminal domain-containing protein n=1 Tax=Desulfatitalea tepidiphila TaxID=1185843 RepID=UPI0006B54E61|nr:type VI secretion protein IcmF/TssM N-terminal domain-containing protein [Desulfatitalea tepidiphila]